MNVRSFRIAWCLIAALAIAAGASGRGARSASAAPIPVGTAHGDTPPPLEATATPSPSGDVVSWSGQILDDRGGFVFFTTGDAFRIAPNLKIVAAAGGGSTKLVPETGVYARASFDTGTGDVVELALSKRKLESDSTFASIKKFVVALSTPYANPDLALHTGGPGGGGGLSMTGKPVLVTFTVRVPSSTPFSDQVYIATDVSGWSATAIAMNRVDALHYRVTLTFRSGTKFLYRFTRGSWSSAERGQNGLEVAPRQLVVADADVRNVDDTVYAWGDENQFSPGLGGAIPTPFNPIPFNTPPRTVR